VFIEYSYVSVLFGTQVATDGGLGVHGARKHTTSCGLQISSGGHWWVCNVTTATPCKQNTDYLMTHILCVL